MESLRFDQMKNTGAHKYLLFDNLCIFEVPFCRVHIWRDLSKIKSLLPIDSFVTSLGENIDAKIGSRLPLTRTERPESLISRLCTLIS